MVHQCGSCGESGCTGLCRAALPEDIVARLLAMRCEDVAKIMPCGPIHGCVCAPMTKAAAEIERLRAALREIASTFGDTADDHMRRRARAALGEDGA